MAFLSSKDYHAEIFAFTNRIGVSNVEKAEIVKALTTATYQERADVEGGTGTAAPSRDDSYGLLDNQALISKGQTDIENVLKPFLRCNMSAAPEELVEAVVEEITSENVLADIALSIGLDALVRTAEHPPSRSTLADCLLSLVAVMSQENALTFAMDLIVPQLIDVDFVDVFPLTDPLSVLEDLLMKNGAEKVEPRLLRSIGEYSAQPVYVVGIYKDRFEIAGQSAGENVHIACDMAAREGLLRLWKLTPDHLFFFGDEARKSPMNEFQKENYRLSKVCSKSTDCSVQTWPEDEEPLNLVEMALKYKNEVDAVVGKSYTKRLRHKFSRGSLHKRSHRYLVKPKVYTVA